MPQHVSVTPTTSANQSDGARNGPGIMAGGQVEGGDSHNYPHMTVDGRRRPKPSRSNEVVQRNDDHWQDWTSTWRKMGTKGHSQPVTMTGTITRGKKKGQVVDVQLDLTDRELMELSNARDLTQESVPDSPGSLPSSGFEPKTGCSCGLNAGPHVLLLSVVAFPFILIASLLASFYFGALTWQNIFTHFYDERTIWHRIFFCPILVLMFPLFIVLFTIGIATYAASIQLSWSFLNWKDEVGSLEKGFYGWLCGKLGLEDCSPYTVVELFDSSEAEGHGEDRRQITNGGELAGNNPVPGRVAVVYAETENGRVPSNRHVELRRQPRHSNSLPTTGCGHATAQRVESSL